MKIPRSRAAEIRAANRDRIERERLDMARRIAKPVSLPGERRQMASEFDQLLDRLKEGKR